MTTATYNVQTIAGVNKIWRKVQGDVQDGAQFISEEWQNLDELPEYEIDWSGREITVPIDINDDFGIASIPDGGYEARPGSPNAEEITLTWVTLNGRFSVSKMSKWIDQKKRAAMIERQIVFQGKKKLQALGRRFSEYFYGFPNATVAKTSTIATQASGVYTLLDAYGVSGLGPVTNAFNVANFFTVGDYVALIRASALVANAIGNITAITPATPSITVTWLGSVTSANGDSVVFANSMENTTIAGTDFNAGPEGLLSMMTSTSVHSLSSASVARWAPGYTTTTAGRFTGITLRKMKQGIYNGGDGTLDRVLWSNGIENDLVAAQLSALRFSDPFGMEIDGSVKAKGVKFMTSRRVPNGFVFAWDRRGVRKMTLLSKPGAPSWDDGEKIPDRSGYVFPVDFPYALVTTNRKRLAYASNQTEQ